MKTFVAANYKIENFRNFFLKIKYKWVKPSRKKLQSLEKLMEEVL